MTMEDVNTTCLNNATNTPYQGPVETRTSTIAFDLYTFASQFLPPWSQRMLNTEQRKINVRFSLRKTLYNVLDDHLCATNPHIESNMENLHWLTTLSF